MGATEVYHGAAAPRPEMRRGVKEAEVMVELLDPPAAINDSVMRTITAVTVLSSRTGASGVWAMVRMTATMGGQL